MVVESNITHKNKSQVIKENLWGILLAGGQGNRLRSLVENLYGYHRPKQYCTFVGSRSLIRHTIDRAQPLIPSNRLLSVVTRNHVKFVAAEMHDRPPETILFQPYGRDTGAGILYPMLKINKSNPESVVVILPTDHFIYNESRFMNYVREACVFVEGNPDRIVMIGVRPDQAEVGYGWIEQGDKIENKSKGSLQSNITMYSVRKFWEKPDRNIAQTLWTRGFLCNTFVLIGKSSLFLQMIKQCSPELFSSFKPIWESDVVPFEDIVIEEIYKRVPALNFSQSVLEFTTEYLCVMEATNIGWNDWGTGQRIINDVLKYNLGYQNIQLESEKKIFFNAFGSDFYFDKKQANLKDAEHNCY